MSSKRHLLPRRRMLTAITRSNVGPRSACPFCTVSTSRIRLPTYKTTPSRTLFRRDQSTTPAADPRAELQQVIIKLKETAPEFVNLAKLDLVWEGLRQTPGKEAVRIAILAQDSDDAPQTTKRLLKALLADPLVDRQKWEEDLDAHDGSKPLIVRVGPTHDGHGQITIGKPGDLSELHVSSPALNDLGFVILLSSDGNETELLINDYQSLPETIPAHKVMVVSDGFQGAVELSSAMPLALEQDETFRAVANLEGISPTQLETGFHNVDVSQAVEAIKLFRQGPQYAMEYQRLWNASNVAPLLVWLKDGAKSSSSSTKPAVRRLIAKFLQDAGAELDAEDARKTARALAIKNLPQAQELNQALSQWAQSAHAELQGELDLAFTGRRWRKLGWWKLYWRVDDVAMLTNEMLSQRFLPTAEQELVYLTGRIAGPQGDHHEYSQPKSVRDDGTLVDQSVRKFGSGEIGTNPSALPKWPGHISFTRRYLQNETIPALQALAQKLVMQSLGTSGVTTSLATLLYVSSFASTIYEAGAVAALGIVYSLGRMQKKWETARSFWEGDVREEGRKAVRGTEESIAEALNGIKASQPGPDESKIEKTRELVAQAEDALARMK